MAVYTEVDPNEVQQLAHALNLGLLRDLRGIPSGIENTNYFLTTDAGEFVLTIFERLSFEQLPYYLHLMRHLADRGIPVPRPQGEEMLYTLAGKPAAIVNKLSGAWQLEPTAEHCAQVGAMLARMHLAGEGFTMNQPNLRGMPWMVRTASEVTPFLDDSKRELLETELATQLQFEATAEYRSLPAGPVHADLFRDNALFDGNRLSGFFDFYFAGDDTFLFDIATCLNDWCNHRIDGSLNDNAIAFNEAYETVRPFTITERASLSMLLRRAALRFWLSRLWDWHLPRKASMLKPHDPAHFERILRNRRSLPQ